MISDMLEVLRLLGDARLCEPAATTAPVPHATSPRDSRTTLAIVLAGAALAISMVSLAVALGMSAPFERMAIPVADRLGSCSDAWRR